MKFPPLLLLATPLVTAHTLQARQSNPPTADEVGAILGQTDPSNAGDCLTLCSFAAFADSSNSPRCRSEDAACMCNDEGWANSLTSCVNRVCTQAIVGDIFDALKVACKRAQAPVKSDPSYDGGVSLAEESASALSSAISAASSVILHTSWPTTAVEVPTSAANTPASDASSPTSAPSSSPAAPDAVKTSETVPATSATAQAATGTASPAATTSGVGNTSGAGAVRAGGVGTVVALLGAMLIL